jgi:hypothetical protein
MSPDNELLKQSLSRVSLEASQCLTSTRQGCNLTGATGFACRVPVCACTCVPVVQWEFFNSFSLKVGDGEEFAP